MSTVKIGKLTEVDVRDLWKHEQYDFSNWLAKEENIKLLDDEIGLTLMDINKEVYIVRNLLDNYKMKYETIEGEKFIFKIKLK